MMTISIDIIPQMAESPSDSRNHQNDSTHTSQDIGFDRQLHDLN
jgi:hypothetical protein